MRRLFFIPLVMSAALLWPPPASGYDSGVGVTVATWSSDTGHGYVGVQADGQWAPPASTTQEIRTTYYSEWRWGATILTNPLRTEWWVYIHNRSDDSIVNLLTPIMVITSQTTPGIGIERQTAGVADLYLAVSVDPVVAPAGTARTVTARLTAGWLDALGDVISAYVIHDSVQVERWTVDFGDGTRATFPGSGTRLTTTHTYGPGAFDVVVRAHVTGRAYGAFFTPDGAPAEQTVPFALDISNRASGVSALPIEYVAPVVTVGGSPSGTLPDGTLVPPDAVGHAALWWPRGLPCALYVRPIIEREGFMRSGGLVIGGATTRLVAYRYEGGVNDASDATSADTYPADAPVRIQWNTPLAGQAAYPVRLVLELETTYADGTVRTSEVSGAVSVSVVYSAVTH